MCVFVYVFFLLCVCARICVFFIVSFSFVSLLTAPRDRMEKIRQYMCVRICVFFIVSFSFVSLLTAPHDRMEKIRLWIERRSDEDVNAFKVALVSWYVSLCARMHAFDRCR
jgi:hypothetical protein